MKHILLTVFSFILFSSVQAQNSSIVVDYTLTLDMQLDEIMKSVPSAQKAMVEDMFRQELENGIEIQYQLKSNGVESNYKLQPKLSNTQGTPGFLTQQIMSADKGVIYKDLKNMTFKKDVEIFGQKYLVVDSLHDYQWKISRERENISGFNVRKATGMLNDSTSLTAWYTPEIAIKDGPDRIFGLPGLVIKTTFELNGAEATVTATNVAVKEEEIKIEMPSGGKQVTQKELETEIKATIEKYQQMSSEGVELD